jgi:hypothetical protein
MGILCTTRAEKALDKDVGVVAEVEENLARCLRSQVQRHGLLVRVEVEEEAWPKPLSSLVAVLA